MGQLESILKRSFDIAISLVSLPLLSPVFLVVAILIRLDSEGPSFYRSLRVGRDGNLFPMWKFRTMQVHSQRFGITTGKNDPRVTRVGRFLRKYKIDELPQLINVLKGDMSLVGPRPDFVEHTSLYRGEERLILSVRPGITDYASIRFYNLAELVGSDDPHRVFVEELRDEKNRLRLAYVKRQSLREDFRILFLTFRILMRH